MTRNPAPPSVEIRCPQSKQRFEVLNSAGCPLGQAPCDDVVRGCPECGRELTISVDAQSWTILPEHDKTGWLLALERAGRTGWDAR